MKLRSIHIETANNGFTLEKRYEPMTKTERDIPYESRDEKSVHESVDSVLKAVKHCLMGKKNKVTKNFNNEIRNKAVDSY